MVQGCEKLHANQLTASRAPEVSYQSSPTLAGNVLADFRFSSNPSPQEDARVFEVALATLAGDAHEIWTVEGEVVSGHEGDLRWSRGGGWLFCALEADERIQGGPEGAARHAYATLARFLRQQPECHVQRLWNYLGGINRGEGDDERYKHFCHGRAEGMGDWLASGFPAATAIGHHAGEHLLQVYLLAGSSPGHRVENPRQVSAWEYPRQYGRTSPSFSRATLLCTGDALAISGTASVIGHATAHEGLVLAQLDETLRNLDALLASGSMPAGFDGHSPLKVYVRHRDHAALIHDSLAKRLPGVPLLLLHGDICRADLLLEIDGWRYGQSPTAVPTVVEQYSPQV
ncbi:pteridine-dependent deoxygenase [Pinirhizobacter soli]|uniref:chorismate transformation enzyme, FkbO/Hyg5 family n=1 Tax=Pinirhizobacter soli TaxID=2786953 RepID=UPI00202AAD19|nr:pteridine-dependent deoxygenase [Pinirhizobacter soli]